MTALKTNLERKLFAALVKARVRYHRDNPEVGFGPMPTQVVEAVAREQEVFLDPEEVAELAKPFLNQRW